MTCTPTALVDAAIEAGFNRISPLQADAIEIQLLCELANNGAGGGGETGSGSPEGVVTANPGVTYWDSTNEVFWVKSTGTGNTGWYQLVGG